MFITVSSIDFIGLYGTCILMKARQGTKKINTAKFTYVHCML